MRRSRCAGFRYTFFNRHNRHNQSHIAPPSLFLWTFRFDVILRNRRLITAQFVARVLQESERAKDGQTDRQKKRQTDRQRQRQRYGDRQRHRQSDRETKRDRDTERDRDIESVRHTKTDRQTDKRDRQ